MKNFLRFLVLFLFFSTITGSVHAVEFRTGDSIVLSEDTMIDGNLFVAGNDVVVHSKVTGDIMCAGKNITITGPVGGDILCVGQAITVTGDVGGSMRTASQNLSLDGSVNRNVTSLGQNVGISSGVGGDVYVGANQLISNATVAGSLYAAVDTLEVNGAIGKDVHVTASTLKIGESASIAGELQYESEKNAQIAQGAVVGKLTHNMPSDDVKKVNSESKKDQAVSFGKKVLEKIWSFLIVLGLGILFIVLFPRFSVNIRTEMEKQVGASIAIGFLIMFSVPLAILFFTVTLIGIPVAILVGFAFALALLVSRLSIALVMGKRVIEALKIKNHENVPVQMIVGTVLTWLVFSVPVLGGMLEFFGCVWALGAVARVLDTRKKK